MGNSHYRQTCKDKSVRTLQLCYLKCQNKKCPIFWFDNALLNKNSTRSQYKYDSCFSAWTSCNRNKDKSSSLWTDYILLFSLVHWHSNSITYYNYFSISIIHYVGNCYLYSYLLYLIKQNFVNIISTKNTTNALMFYMLLNFWIS